MTLSSGTRLGPYEIVAPIGAGGMGEVYRGRDVRLERNVAIKILSPEFAQDAKLKIRFQREAKALSELSHPNICTLYDVGENYLVLELLDGETVAERLRRGPLPLADVFEVGIQIAQALGRAHSAGIAHRDLKPANIMLTKTGAKLLDFGLAKHRDVVVIDGPTAHQSLTQEGTILGTFQYMAPEQLEGQDADARTDIFAFGTVLYEMVTGKRAFEGKSKPSLIAAIVSTDPKPVSAVQPLTPPALEHVIKKCLEKDPDARWQSASDVAEELRWISQNQRTESSPKFPWRTIAAVALSAAMIGAVSAYVLFKVRAVQPRMYNTELNPPEDAMFDLDAGAGVLSPDGRKIAFVAKRPGSASLIWLRNIDSPAASPLKGTENPLLPFWSPDSKAIGFFADGKLKRIDAAGGTPEILTSAVTPRGGSWGSQNVIVFAPTSAGPILRISAAGGEAKPVTRLDIKRGDASHRFPAFLPNGRQFLVFIQGVSGPNILLASIDSSETRLLGRSEAAVVFAPPHWLLLVKSGSLRAQRLDPDKLELVGDAVSVADVIQINRDVYLANVSASNDGILAYVGAQSSTTSAFKVVDRSGKELTTLSHAADQYDPRMAPDGSALAFTRTAVDGPSRIWLLDLRRNVETQLTSISPQDWSPVWSPDSKSIVYTSLENRPGNLIVKRIDGSATEVLLADDRRKVASDWSADGRYVIFQALSPASQWDIDAYSIREKKIIPLVRTPAAEILGHVSPDGRWLAYASDVSGRMEIYVQEFPAGARKWQISSDGGTMPAWSRDGLELYYCALNGRMMATPVRTDNGFVAAAAQFLFETRLRGFVSVVRNQYDVIAGKRFVTNVPTNEARPVAITLVQNWSLKIAAPEP